MASAQPGDSFLVNRNGTSYYVLQENLMASVQDDDLLLINRAGSSYKITGADLKGSFETFSVDTPTLIYPANGTEIPDPNNLTLTASAYAANPSAEIVPFGSSRWQISTVDFSSEDFTDEDLVLDAVNQSPTAYTLSNTPSETDVVLSSTLAGGSDYNLTFDGNTNLDTFEVGEKVSCNAAPLAPDMSGLRFDGNNRESQLQKTLGVSGEAWTIAFWIKATSWPGYVMDLRESDASTEIVIYNTGTTIECDYLGSSNRLTAATPLNTWTSIVWNFDGTNVELFANGVSQGTKAVTGADLLAIYNIGRPQADSSWLNAYLSEYYHVNGQALPATAFGTLDAGLWKPLSPSEIKDNIDYRFAAEAPYATRPNYAQWSSSGTEEPAGYATSNPITDAFGGNPTTVWRPDPTQNATGVSKFTFGTPVPAAKLELNCYIDNQTTAYLKVNGKELTGPNIPTQSVGMVDASHLLTDGKLNSLEVFYGILGGQTLPGSSAISQIFVDGRELIDGSANNSQNWSAAVSLDGNTLPGDTITSVFNGQTLTGGGLRTNNTADATYTITFDDPPTVTDKVTLYYWGETSSNGTAVINDGTDNVLVDFSGDKYDGTPFEATGVTQLKNIKFSSGDNGSPSVGVSGLAVDGKLLIDSGAQWNTSAVWSNGTTTDDSFQADGQPHMGFDGNESTRCTISDSGINNTITIAFNPALSGELEILNNAGRGYLVNGIAASPSPDNGTTGLIYRSLGSFGNIDTLTITGDDNAVEAAFHSIKVDGKILVDNAPFGVNGFYLPFSPDAEPVNYLINTTATQVVSNRGPEFIYNGQEEGRTTDDSTASCVVEAGGKITLSNVSFENVSSFTITESHNNTITYKFNGGTEQTLSTATGQTNYDVPLTAPSTITSVEFNCAEIGSNSFFLSNMKVNGVTLIDCNSIGVDASGNGNDFHDQNFAVGNTSEMWSQYLAASDPFTATYTPQMAFNGNVSSNNGASPQEDGSSITFNPGITIPANSIIEVCGGESSANWNVSVDGGADQTVPSGLQFTPITYNNGTTFPELTITNAGGGSAFLIGVKLNGALLVNANVQDTVIDTPVTPYAVMTAGGGGEASNGNLNTTGGSDQNYHYGIYPLDGGSYYAEYQAVGSLYAGVGLTSTPSGGWGGRQTLYFNGTYSSGGTDSTTTQTWDPVTDTIGIVYQKDAVKFFKNGVPLYANAIPEATYYFAGVTSAQNNKYQANFGQQPFAYATNNMDGTCVVPAAFNTSKEWSNNVTPTDAVSAKNVTNAFDGQWGDAEASDDDVDYVSFKANTEVYLFQNQNFENATSLRVYSNIGYGTTTIKVNGAVASQAPTTDGNSYEWVTITGWKAPLTSLSIEETVGWSISAIEVDGSILVDTSAFNTSANWTPTTTASADAAGSPCTVLNAYDGSDNGIALFKGDFLLSNVSISCSSEISFYYSAGASVTVDVNGSQVGTLPAGSTTGTQSVSFTGTISNLKLSSSSDVGLRWIKVDDVMLVDTSQIEAQNYRTVTNTEAEALSLEVLTGTVKTVTPGSNAMTVTADANMDWTEAKNNRVLGEQKTGLLKDTTYYARVRHSSNNGVDSDFSTANEFSTGTTPPPLPELLPGGLRFDGQRKTYLSRTLDSSQTNFSLSFWLKVDSFNNSEYLYWTDDGQGKNWYISLNNNVLRFYGTAGKAELTLPAGNTWYNVVYAQYGDHGDLYLNGAKQDQSNSMSNGPFLGQVNWGVYPADYTDGYISGFNGYLSEVYMVSGIGTLQPTLFGKSVNGVWTPRDNSEILADIDAITLASPYDTRPNMDKDWSAAGVTGATVNDLTDMFDGSLESWTYVITNPGSATYTFSPAITDVSSLRFYANDGGLTSADGFLVNGNDYSNLVPAEFAWFEVPETSLSTITFKGVPGGYTMYIAAVEVNGRILVDGPADNSQNWSDGVSNATDAAKMFNGSIADGASNDVNGGTSTVSFSPALTVSSGLRVYNDTSTIDIKVNEEEFVTFTGVEWKNLNFTGSLNTITWKHSAGAKGTINAVEVDAKILIDAGAQWNTSQVWSNSLIASPQGFNLPASNAFDGDITTLAATKADVNENMTFTYTFNDVTSLRVYQDQGTDYLYSVNGGTAVTASSLGVTTNKSWVDLTSLVPSNKTVTSIYTSVPTDVNNGVNWGAIEVNGKLLVDNLPFGTEGYYLPFNADAEGFNYSQYLTSNDTFYANREPVLAFNGDLSANKNGAATSDGATLTFNPGITIPANSIIEVNCGTASASWNLSVDGGANQTIANDDSFHAITYDNGTRFPSLAITSQGSGSADLIGVKLNGVLLVDHNNIGVDASGTGNNFFDQNFAVGNTSEVWSKYVTSSTGDFDTPPSYIFNGNTSTGGNPTSGGGTSLTFTPSEGIPYTNQIQVYKGGSGTFSINDGEITGNLDTGSWNTIVDNASGTLNKLVITGSDFPDWRAITIDGKFLIDDNIQDTVLDQPVTNFAVFTDEFCAAKDSTNVSSNGNLDATFTGIASMSTTIGSQGKYYAEFTCTGGSADNSSEYGYVGIITTATTDLGVLGYGNSYAYQSYSGDKVSDGSGESYGDDWAPGDIIGVAFDSDGGDIIFHKNGVSQGVAYANITSTSYRFACSAINSGWSYTGNFGQQPFAYADNTTLRQGKVTYGGIVYNTLYTPIVQSAGSGDLFYVEALNDVVTASQLKRNFGIHAADPAKGIYELSEQPTYDVRGYTFDPATNKYQPIRTFEHEFHRLQNTLRNVSTPWAQGESYQNGQIISYSNNYYVVNRDYTVSVVEAFDADAIYLTPIHS